MAKKKTTTPIVFTPITPVQTVQDAVQKVELKVIPPYPDQGVAYAKYSKKLVGNDVYELREQLKFHKYGQLTSANTSDDYSFPANQKLNVVGIFVTYSLTAALPNGYFYIGDLATGGGARVKLNVNLIKTSDSLFIDLSGCPLQLENDYIGLGGTDQPDGLKIGSLGLGAGDYINYVVFGFLESY